MLIKIGMFDETDESLLNHIATDNLNCYVCDKHFKCLLCEKQNVGVPFSKSLHFITA